MINNAFLWNLNLRSSNCICPAAGQSLTRSRVLILQTNVPCPWCLLMCSNHHSDCSPCSNAGTLVCVCSSAGRLHQTDNCSQWASAPSYKWHRYLLSSKMHPHHPMSSHWSAVRIHGFWLVQITIPGLWLADRGNWPSSINSQHLIARSQNNHYAFTLKTRSPSSYPKIKNRNYE